jgi:D-galactarolactone cycloisomerase
MRRPCRGGAVLIAANPHLLSLLPDPDWGLPSDTPLLELDQSENSWRTEIVRFPFVFQQGFVGVPTEPRLGIEVDESIAEKYAVR